MKSTYSFLFALMLLLTSCNNNTKVESKTAEASKVSAQTIKAVPLNPIQVNDIKNNFDWFYKNANPTILCDSNQIDATALFQKINTDTLVNGKTNFIGFRFGINIVGSTKKLVYLICTACKDENDENAPYVLNPLKDPSSNKFVMLKDNQLIDITNNDANQMETNFVNLFEVFKIQSNNLVKVKVNTLQNFPKYSFYEMREINQLFVDNGLVWYPSPSSPAKLVIGNGARIQMNGLAFNTYKTLTPFIYIEGRLSQSSSTGYGKYTYRALDFGEFAPPPPVQQ